MEGGREGGRKEGREGGREGEDKKKLEKKNKQFFADILEDNYLHKKY